MGQSPCRDPPRRVSAGRRPVEQRSESMESCHAWPARDYKVRVTKDYLVFCSGHFITYAGDQCERIHGHNYRVGRRGRGRPRREPLRLRLHRPEGPDPRDHRRARPPDAPADAEPALIRLEEDGPNWRVRYRDRPWSFPRDECALLPIANTTAELLADYIAGRLREAIVGEGARRCRGCSASRSRRASASRPRSSGRYRREGRTTRASHRGAPRRRGPRKLPCLRASSSRPCSRVRLRR